MSQSGRARRGIVTRLTVVDQRVAVLQVNHLDHQMLHSLKMQNADNHNHEPSASRTRCLDTEELGQYLGLSGRTIDRLRQTGALTYRRFGSQVRFSPEDIAEFVAKSRVVEGAEP